MRDGLLRLHQPRGDGLAHAVERHFLERHVAIERQHLGRRRTARHGSARARLRGGRRLDVARDDAPMRARWRDAAEIDAGLAGEPSCEWRHRVAADTGRTEIALRRAHLEERIERAAGGPCGGSRTRGRRGGRCSGGRFGWRRRRRGSLRLGRRAVARNHCNHGADRRHLAHADADFRERAGGGRRHLHRHLVGLDLEQVVARLHGVAGRLEPLRDLALSHGLAELRHQHVHQQFLTSCVPSTRNSSCRPY